MLVHQFINNCLIPEGPWPLETDECWGKKGCRFISLLSSSPTLDLNQEMPIKHNKKHNLNRLKCGNTYTCPKWPLKM